LADAIRRELGVEAKLVEGAGGIFDVKADGRLVYSKHQTGRFPEDEEILSALGRKAGGKGG
jgi:selenoprotein W-related protein